MCFNLFHHSLTSSTVSPRCSTSLSPCKTWCCSDRYAYLRSKLPSLHPSFPSSLHFSYFIFFLLVPLIYFTCIYFLVPLSLLITSFLQLTISLFCILSFLLTFSFALYHSAFSPSIYPSFLCSSIPTFTFSVASNYFPRSHLFLFFHVSSLSSVWCLWSSSVHLSVSRVWPPC